MALGFAEPLLSVCRLSAAWAAGGEGRRAGLQLGESPISSPCYCPRDTGVRFPGSLRVACPARGCKAAVWVGSACSWSGLAPTVLGGGSVEIVVRSVECGGGACVFNKIWGKWQVASSRDLGSLRQLI